MNLSLAYFGNQGFFENWRSSALSIERLLLAQPLIGNLPGRSAIVVSTPVIPTG